MPGASARRPPTPQRMNGPISKRGGSMTDLSTCGGQSGALRVRRQSVDETRGSAGGTAPEGQGRNSGEKAPRAERGDGEDANVKVFVRVRPANQMELADEEASVTVAVTSSQSCIISTESKEPCQFTFDRVFDETTTQEQMCEATGVPLVDNCMNGYNSTIFAYGQTGAGKTHTMMGNLEVKELRGLTPRVLEMMFERIRHEQQQGAQFRVDCTFLEIYNETITDLLEPSTTNMQIRESNLSGAYVEGLKTVKIDSADEALGVMKQGAENRRVAETKANRTSSRSHMVFTCAVQKKTTTRTGVEKKTYSRLNLVDLAGSERNSVSGAKSDTLREACFINQSLTTLGRVIRGLADAQKPGHGRVHVPYRDSKLTYLLQESLGGNAKTSIIANISPMSLNAQESLSTLQFVKRAKDIRQKFRINEAMNHQSEALQNEVRRLKNELDDMRVRFTEPLQRENSTLKERLQTEVDKISELQTRLDESAAMNASFKEQVFELQHEIRDLKDDRCSLKESLDDLLEQAELLSCACTDVDTLRNKAAATEIGILSSELDTQKEKTRTAELATEEKVKEVEVLEVKLANMCQELSMLRSRERDILGDLEAAHSSITKFQEEVENTTEDLAAARTAHDELQVRESQLTEELVKAKGSLETCEDDLKEKISDLKVANSQISLKNQEVDLLREQLGKSQKDLQDTRDSLATVKAELSQNEEDVHLLREKLDAQDSKVRGIEEDLLEARKLVEEKDAEVAAYANEVHEQRIALEEKSELCRTLEDQNMELQSQLAMFMEQRTEQAMAHMELQKNMGEMQCRSESIVNERCMEIEELQGMYKEVFERASDAEARLEQLSVELERLFQYNFQCNSFVDGIESLLDDVEGECPEDIAKKLEDYEKRGDCNRTMRNRSSRKSSRRSERSTPITPPAAAARYGVLHGQVPGGFAAYCNMPSETQRMLSKHGSMSAREVWRTGFL